MQLKTRFFDLFSNVSRDTTSSWDETFYYLTERFSREFFNKKSQQLLALLTESSDSLEQGNPLDGRRTRDDDQFQEIESLMDSLDDQTVLHLLLDEDLLGTILEQHVVDNRKSRGMYFTPPAIIEKILEETLDQKVNTLLENLKQKIKHFKKEMTDKKQVTHAFLKTFRELQELTVVDPACGSGKFLVASFKRLRKAYLTLGKLWDEVTVSGLTIEGQSFIPSSNINDPVTLNFAIILPQLRGIDKNHQAVFLTRLKLLILAITSIPPESRDWNVVVNGCFLLCWTIQRGDSLLHAPLDVQLKVLNDPDVKKQLKFLIKRWNERERWFRHSSKVKNFVEDCNEMQNQLNRSVIEEINEKDLGITASLKIQDSFHWALTWWDGFIQVNEHEEVSLKSKGGFSIIVGNPPYFTIRGKGKGHLQRTQYHEYFKKDPFWKRWFRSQSDIYYYFIMDGVQHLQLEGKLGFIVEDYWIENDHADRLREYLLTRTRVEKIVKFDEVTFLTKVFHSLVIIILSRTSHWDHHAPVIIEKHSAPSSSDSGGTFDQERQRFEIPRRILGKGKWVLTPTWKEFWKLRKNGLNIVPLGDLPRSLITRHPLEFDFDCNLSKTTKTNDKIEGIARVFQGMSPGRKDVFVLPKKRALELKLEEEFLRPLIVNSDVRRYHIRFSDKMIIYPRLIRHLDVAPRLSMYLESHKSKLLKGSDRKRLLEQGRIRWFDYNVYRNYKLFESTKPKIICPYRSTITKFALDDQKSLFTTDCYGIVLKDSARIDLYYLLGLLNSSVIERWYRHLGKRKGRVFEMFSNPLRRIPILMASPSDQQYVKKRVLEIIRLTKMDDYSLNLDEMEKKERNEKIKALSSEINEKIESLHGF